MKSLRVNAWVFCLVVLFASVVEAQVKGPQVVEYRGATLVSEEVLGSKEFDLVLSAPKRISNDIVIEQQELVKGAAWARLYEISSGFQLSDAYEYFQQYYTQNGQVLFHCEKRACGSSNHWANKVFDEHKLYGRDSSQYYLAAKLDSGKQEVWKAAYIVQNGLRKKYIYELTFVGETHQGLAIQKPQSVWVNGSAFGEGGLSSSQLNALRAYSQSTGMKGLYLVAYSDTDLKPTASHWEQLRTKVQLQVKKLQGSMELVSVPVETRLLGPLHEEAPLEKWPVWFKLYVY